MAKKEPEGERQRGGGSKKGEQLAQRPGGSYAQQEHGIREQGGETGRDRL